MRWDDGRVGLLMLAVEEALRAETLGLRDDLLSAEGSAYAVRRVAPPKRRGPQARPRVNRALATLVRAVGSPRDAALALLLYQLEWMDSFPVARCRGREGFSASELVKRLEVRLSKIARSTPDDDQALVVCGVRARISVSRSRIAAVAI